MSKILSTGPDYAGKAGLAALPRDAVRRDKIALVWQILQMATARKKIPSISSAGTLPVTLNVTTALVGLTFSFFISTFSAVWTITKRFEKTSVDVKGLEVGQANIAKELAELSTSLKDLNGQMKDMNGQMNDLKMSYFAVDHRLLAVERGLGFFDHANQPSAMPQPKAGQRR